ncbi:MAG: phosphoglucomutase/phosphomannomutase family protein, partial [Bacteroidia bacterium]|nr:phosphoglucomutase/phosphomannomutase family protein [Bacteroidia bacterium]
MLNSTNKPMYSIKFGTDGWREIIADNFTAANVRRVAYATAKWLKNSNLPQVCVVGHDCRFGGKLFARETAAILANEGISVILAPQFVSTPMISLAAPKHNAGLGVIITASHNPAEYNGFKIKAHYGGPATPSVIAEIEDLIPAHDVPAVDFDSLANNGSIVTGDFESLYLSHVESNFDMTALVSMAPHL